MEALQDTVILRNQDQSLRNNKLGRSQTQTTQPVGSNGRPQLHLPHRSLSEDSNRVATPEKTKSSKSKSGKKGSIHADVIDRLDFSGVGPMFHHDGPFDACAPSRNRHQTKAPMAAWSVAPDGTPITSPEVKVQPVAQTYMPQPPPRKNVDAIAEAWGIHEPEPYEDFSAGGGHINDYRQNHTPTSTISKRSNHDDVQQSARRPNRKGSVPPPQPIFVPEADEEISTQISPVSSSPGGGMKRSKSLMHRIRKMREMPNVPVNNDELSNDGYEGPPSPAANRPTHRSQNSFLGRFGRSTNGNGNGREYTGSPPVDDETYVYIDYPKDKQLPKPPLGSSGFSPKNDVDGDSRANYISQGSNRSPGGGGGGGGVGSDGGALDDRKRNLLKIVGKAVTGQK